jgi:hypothetical protein
VDCDFAKARAIDCHLDRPKVGHIETQFVLDLKKEALRVKAANALQSARDAVFETQAAFQNRLIALYTAHTQELEALSEQYSEALELELIRIVPEAIQLKKQAQATARLRDYSLADILYHESNETYRQQIEKKKSEVRQLFNKKKDRIEARQNLERHACKDKQERDIEFIQQKFNADMARFRASLSKTAVDLGMTLTEEDLAFLNEFQLRDQLRSPCGSTRGSASGSGSRPSTPSSSARPSPRQSPSVV